MTWKTGACLHACECTCVCWGGWRFLIHKLRAHNFSTRSLKQQSTYRPPRHECGTQRGTWMSHCVCVCVCASVCGGLDRPVCVCVIRWLLLYILQRDIKRAFFPPKKHQWTKGLLTRQCVCVFGKRGLVLLILDPLNSPQLWPTANDARQYLVCVCKDNFMLAAWATVKSSKLNFHTDLNISDLLSQIFPLIQLFWWIPGVVAMKCCIFLVSSISCLFSVYFNF